MGNETQGVTRRRANASCPSKPKLVSWTWYHEWGVGRIFDTHTRTSLARSAEVGSTTLLTDRRAHVTRDPSCQKEYAIRHRQVAPIQFTPLTAASRRDTRSKPILNQALVHVP